MNFSRFTFTESYKDWITLLFDFDIRTIHSHKRNTFDDYKSLIHFKRNNATSIIHITIDQIDDFYQDWDRLVVNLYKYQEFCKNIWQNWKNRAQAFFSRWLRDYTDEEKKWIIANSTDEEILERIKNFSQEQKDSFIRKIGQMQGISMPTREIDDYSDDEFLTAFIEFAKNPNKQKIILENYPRVQIEILEQYKLFLEANLDKNETFIQNWIDWKIDDLWNIISCTEDEIKKCRKSRCLIFGLEFISHKSQGELSRKRFDILTRLSEDKNEHVIIELKSPCKEVFEVKEVDNMNWWKSTEYHLSADIARSIPQISHYRNWLENKSETDDDFQRIWIQKGKVAKSMIVIWTRHFDDPIWEENFISLQRNFSNWLEIITYSDLIKKLDTTIKNLRDNL